MKNSKWKIIKMDFSITKKIAAFFRSRKLALALILLIITFAIIGTRIPQQSQLKPEVYNAWKTTYPSEAYYFEKLGLTNLFSSYLFLSLGVLLFINTLFCTRDMLVNVIRRLSSKPQFQQKAYITRLENHRVFETSQEDKKVISGIRSALESQGYKVAHKENKIFAEKNRYGALGTPLFHVFILFIILASVVGGAGRMEGNLRLVEGQTLSEEHGNYIFINEGPFFNENHQNFDIKLEKFYAHYVDESGIPRGNAGKLVISEKGKEMQADLVYSNHQMFYKGYTFLGNVYGLAPLLILMRADGSVYSGSYVTASEIEDSGKYAASFDMGRTGLEGSLTVYMTPPGQTPLLLLDVYDSGRKIYSGTLGLNETVRISENPELYMGFYDIKYWSNFYVVKDDGIPLINLGIVFITLSLMISFFIIPKKIWVEVIEDGKKGKTEIYIGGRADKLRSLYEEECCSIVNNIEERLSHGTD